MDKIQYLSKLIFRIKISFYVLLAVTIYEFLYFLSHGSSLAFVLLVLAGAVTYFAYTLMKVFADLRDHSSN